MARVLVTDGEERAALAVVRSLGRAGHDVRVCAARERSLAGASRWARREARVPSPLAEPAAYASAVNALALRWRCDVLLPVSEASALALLAPAGVRPPVPLPFPTREAFRAICDKRRVLEAAEAAGIAVPAQLVLETREARLAVEPSSITCPVVVKPARSVRDEGEGRAKQAVIHAADWVALRVALDDLPEAAYPVLVQQRVVGPGVGIFLLTWDQRVRAVFAHRRLREKPPSGGVSVYRESVAPDPALVRRASALLAAFEWRGVAMVELKVDQATGTPYLMEVNGRFWGSLQLAIDAGVDFPALLLDALAGKPAVPPPAYRPGVRSRWWWGEVDHALARLRRSPRALSLPPGEPGRLAAVARCLAPHRGDRGEVLRWSDPLPAWRETVDWLGGR
ncbi:MAG TPA: ATP-grasp domain-containing protein [Longimicrobium sp.]|nr:ATP-grasp domain-containing protein [Longimicrobium sp.]